MAPPRNPPPPAAPVSDNVQPGAPDNTRATDPLVRIDRALVALELPLAPSPIKLPAQGRSPIGTSGQEAASVYVAPITMAPGTLPRTGSAPVPAARSDEPVAPAVAKPPPSMRLRGGWPRTVVVVLVVAASVVLVLWAFSPAPPDVELAEPGPSASEAMPHDAAPSLPPEVAPAASSSAPPSLAPSGGVSSSPPAKMEARPLRAPDPYEDGASRKPASAPTAPTVPTPQATPVPTTELFYDE